MTGKDSHSHWGMVKNLGSKMEIMIPMQMVRVRHSDSNWEILKGSQKAILKLTDLMRAIQINFQTGFRIMIQTV